MSTDRPTEPAYEPKHRPVFVPAGLPVTEYWAMHRLLGECKRVAEIARLPLDEVLGHAQAEIQWLAVLSSEEARRMRR
ncbi:hypothetical protein KRX51_03115 [Corynebacterium sp. TAE3-ERU12]|uniref:hypothetical protein n=1 Tax=Corynebacterium sp. TAE3-ERU12 TaxID=2849491 RepID=UPI001C476BAB|nr:hypothetical protein [Corynebacterium sp. TAE3-ERU12]MBV7294908.1 hypothetical protein [Corynebacterium sp. TAE3-ERU12]